MLNNSVFSFYDNFGLIYKGSEDKATNGIRNWSFSTTPQLIDASRENPIANVRIKLISSETTQTFSVSDCRGGGTLLL